MASNQGIGAQITDNDGAYMDQKLYDSVTANGSTPKSAKKFFALQRWRFAALIKAKWQRHFRTKRSQSSSTIAAKTDPVMEISHPSESPEAGCSTISHSSESPEAGSSNIVSDVSFHSVYGTDSMVNFYQPYSSSYDGSVSATDSDCDARSYDVDITREQLKQFLVPANYYSDDSDDYDD